MSQQCFVLWMRPSGVDKLPEGLAKDQLIIGWSRARLLDLPDRQSYKAEMKRAYAELYHGVSEARAASWTGIMWRFIKQMSLGDLVAIPAGKEFFIAQVKGSCEYDEKMMQSDTCYRRSCTWLNNGRPLSRAHISAALNARLSCRQTCIEATDLCGDMEQALQ